MEHSKKLVRGLKDISPIFSAPGRPEVREIPDIQILSVSSPHDDGDSLLLNTYFASQLASSEKPCSLVSILSRTANRCAWRSDAQKIEPFGQNIKRHSLFWDELKEILDRGLWEQESCLGSRNIFMDFEYRSLLHLPKVLELLDQWVLLLKPTPESLTEGYKMIKTGLALNPHLECFILLHAKANPPADSTIFEKFSAVASKHLRIHLGWLGWLDLSDPEHFFQAKINVEQLCFKPARMRLSPERLTLSHWVESFEKNPAVGMEDLEEQG